MLQLNLFTVILVLTLIAYIYAVPVRKRDNNDYSKRPSKVVCYFGSWAYWHTAEKFEIKDIDVNLCTHVNYGFAKLNEWEYFIEQFDKDQDGTRLRGYEEFVALRKKNPNLTAMIALGGWWEGSEKYSDMAKDPIRRKRFVESVVNFLREYDFDGLDMDWEYPANRGGEIGNKEHFIELLTELKAAFETDGFLLTAALSPGKPTIETAYVIPKINELLDWANVMTYDYHGGWEFNLGHNSPIYPRPDETDPIHQWFNINYTVHYYLEHGLSKEKFVMGIPFYGRGWTLLDDKHVALNDTAKGMSGPGPATREFGILGYNEICNMFEKDPSSFHYGHDPYYRAPYLYNKTIWMGYESVQSITCKVSFLKEMGLAGAMVWSLENDDFANTCQGGHNPLLNTVHNTLNGVAKDSLECELADIPEQTTTPNPTTVRQTTAEPTTERQTERQTPEATTVKATERPTTVANTATVWISQTIDGQVVSCTESGYQPHPTDIHKYIQCEYIDSGPRKGWYIHIMPCAPGTSWNQKDELCDSPP